MYLLILLLLRVLLLIIIIIIITMRLLLLLPFLLRRPPSVCASPVGRLLLGCARRPIARTACVLLLICAGDVSGELCFLFFFLGLTTKTELRVNP